MEFLFTLLAVLIWIIIISSFTAAFSKRRKKTIASDGHVIPKEKDITCEGRDGHSHPEMSAKDKADFGPRYIVHDDPEIGYVILNGVKRKISDCKNL